MRTEFKVQSAMCKVQVIAVVMTFLLPMVSSAQCAMCRASLEGSDNTQKAEAVNDGIVYLMVFPYLIVGVIGFLIYRMYSKKKTAEEV